MGVFEVDRQGLRKMLERRGKESLLYELVQNCWDQKATEVTVSFTKPAGSRTAQIVVEDDDPNGFADLSHAYTLFADSVKRADPRKRGRFNIGEKLVIAVCEESRIVTTTGGVEFVDNQRRSLSRRTTSGSVFEGTIRVTNAEFEACCAAMRLLLPPAGIKTVFNGELIPPRDPISVVKRISLPTDIADAEGYLRRTTRTTELHIYEPFPGETGMVFEMGIPVVETGDDWHVDVQQKIPVNMDRDNVPPAFIRAIRTAVLNEVHQHLDPESANHLWVKSAMEDPNASEEAIRSVISNRFGDKVVVFDPSDPEANNRAVANGFTVVRGRELSKNEWVNVRRVEGAMPAAGSMFPTHGTPASATLVVPTAQEQKMIDAIKRLARVLIGAAIEVTLISDLSFGQRASYGRRTMTINRARVGRSWFAALDENSLGLIIHELAHEYVDNHLSENYYRTLTKLGARLAIATAREPNLLVL